MVGLNYDYRLIFLITASIGFNLLGSECQKSEFVQSLVWILTIACMWFSFNSNLLQPVGDFAMILLICIFAINLARLHSSFFTSKLDAKKKSIKNVMRSRRDSI
jgi:hypothetical protein